ncbi:radical SAM protein [Pseudomonas koreensis]|uniref:radical SAM/SPASM domain-containing protein n=1 Tax=Pseudomonas koreensis TaxID=198620 RepID=UPI0015770FB9|nr:radical SAM protein [Pseudomonas koreensis]NTZ96980.1 radical SAM protein [Pseudomonas koreensis]
MDYAPYNDETIADDYGEPIMSQPTLIPAVQLFSSGSEVFSSPSQELQTMKLDMASTCNIACSYCFVDEGHALPGPKLMSVDTVNRSISWFTENRDDLDDSLAIVMFGGEPLLNRKGVIAACESIGALRQKGVDVKLQLITNATLATEEISEWLGYAEATIMVSIDGSEEVHNAKRVDHRGLPTYKKVMEGLKQLQRHVPSDRIWARATMTPGTNELEYFDALISAGLRQISLGYVDDTPPVSMTSEAYGNLIDEFMRRLVSLAKKGSPVDMHPISTYLSLLYGELGRGEVWPRYDCGAATRIISVTPDGAIYPCEQAVVARATHNWVLGSVNSGISMDAVGQFLQQTSRTHSGCTNCSSSNMCDQGCRVDSTIDGSRDACHGYESFLLVLWERLRHWYKKLAEEEPRVLINMVDAKSYRIIRAV